MHARRLLRLASVPRRLPSTPSGAAPHSNEPASPAGSEVPGGADHHHHDRGAACAGPTLQSVVLSLRPGELLGVCGEVGSGKSSLLAALLGELQPLQPQDPTAAAATASCDHGHGGDVMPPSKSGSEGAAASLGPVVVGTVAYCAQVPWIVAGSVRDNILFGRPYEEAWYARVVVACALSDDLAALAAGDATELGERGINLSGQRQGPGPEPLAEACTGLARRTYGCRSHGLGATAACAILRLPQPCMHACMRPRAADLCARVHVRCKHGGAVAMAWPLYGLCAGLANDVADALTTSCHPPKPQVTRKSLPRR